MRHRGAALECGGRLPSFGGPLCSARLAARVKISRSLSDNLAIDMAEAWGKHTVVAGETACRNASETRPKEEDMRIRIGLLLLLMVVSIGCSTTHKPVVQKPQYRWHYTTQEYAQVQVELQTLSVDSAAFAAVPHDNLLSAAGLAPLQAAGKAEIVSTDSILTQDGEQATVKSVKEWRYPNEVQSDTEGKGGPAADSGKFLGKTIPVTVFAPADFQTREVGHILNVTPTVTRQGLILLTLVPEITGDPTWESFGPELVGGEKKENAVQLKQPIFSTATATAKIFVPNGERVILSACPAPLDHKRTLVFIIGAKLTKRLEITPELREIPPKPPVAH